MRTGAGLQPAAPRRPGHRSPGRDDHRRAVGVEPGGLEGHRPAGLRRLRPCRRGRGGPAVQDFVRGEAVLQDQAFAMQAHALTPVRLARKEEFPALIGRKTPDLQVGEEVEVPHSVRRRRDVLARSQAGDGAEVGRSPAHRLDDHHPVARRKDGDPCRQRFNPDRCHDLAPRPLVASGPQPPTIHGELLPGLSPATVSPGSPPAGKRREKRAIRPPDGGLSGP